MAFLNKHDVATYDDLRSKVVDVWGGQVKIRILTVKEQQEYAALLEEKDGEAKNYFYFLIKKCCVGENNEPIFNDGDEEILQNKSGDSITFLVNEILSLNNQNPKDVDKLAKNS